MSAFLWPKFVKVEASPIVLKQSPTSKADCMGAEPGRSDKTFRLLEDKAVSMKGKATSEKSKASRRRQDEKSFQCGKPLP